MHPEAVTTRATDAHYREGVGANFAHLRQRSVP
jgi:hypothetical protein